MAYRVDHEGVEGHRDMAPIILTSVQTEMNGRSQAAVSEPNSKMCGAPPPTPSSSERQSTLKTEAASIYETFISIYQTAWHSTQSVICFCVPCVKHIIWFDFVIKKGPVHTSQRTKSISIIKTSRLMLFSGIICIYCENNTTHINTQCG
jgi:hypothetical protein